MTVYSFGVVYLSVDYYKLLKLFKFQEIGIRLGDDVIICFSFQISMNARVLLARTGEHALTT